MGKGFFRIPRGPCLGPSWALAHICSTCYLPHAPAIFPNLEAMIKLRTSLNSLSDTRLATEREIMWPSCQHPLQHLQCEHDHNIAAECRQPWNRAPRRPWSPTQETKMARGQGAPKDPAKGALGPCKQSGLSWGPGAPGAQDRQGILENSRVDLGTSPYCTRYESRRRALM